MGRGKDKKKHVLGKEKVRNERLMGGRIVSEEKVKGVCQDWKGRKMPIEKFNE